MPDESYEHTHNWVDQHEGRTFVNIKDQTDAVIYQACSGCDATRSVKVVPGT